MSVWQPIETVPEGEKVLVWFKDWEGAETFAAGKLTSVGWNVDGFWLDEDERVLFWQPAPPPPEF